MEDLQVVLEGREPDGTEWSVLAGPSESQEEDFYTFIRRSHQAAILRSRVWVV
jgi:hypothetical protein